MHVKAVQSAHARCACGEMGIGPVNGARGSHGHGQRHVAAEAGEENAVPTTPLSGGRIYMLSHSGVTWHAWGMRAAKGASAASLQIVDLGTVSRGCDHSECRGSSALAAS
jgi:hypothetical protein